MKQQLRKFAWPLAVEVCVAIIAYVTTMYIISDSAQRAARYYDPAHNELYVRAFSAAIRLAGSYSPLVVFATLFALGTLFAVWLAVMAPRLLRWFGWSRREPIVRS